MKQIVSLKRMVMVGLVALLATVPQAQQKASRLGFVKVQQAVTVLPGGSSYLELRKKVDADLGTKTRAFQEAAAKANASRSAADQAALNKANQDLTKAQAEAQKKLAEAFKPLASKIDAAIAKVAKANGVSVVMDYDVAAMSKLVVYASDTTDLTPAVMKALK